LEKNIYTGKETVEFFQSAISINHLSFGIRIVF